MGVYERAQREVELYKKKSDPKEDAYVIDICDSALKAFKSLCDDEHSGCSISMTMTVLNRMVRGLPLTAISEDDEWIERDTYGKTEGKSYLSSRMSGFYKDVIIDDDGNEIVSYNDLHRTECVHVDSPGLCYYSGLVNNLFNELHPITLPYMPLSKPIRVFCDDFLYDKANGDFDTVGVFYAIYPDGNIEYINKFYYLHGKNGKEEISKERYNEMKENRCWK